MFAQQGKQMNISINAVFRKDRLNSQNAAPVHLRLTQNRKLKHISTGVTLNINEWDFENQRVKGQTPELQALQLRIDTKIDELRRKIKRLEALEVEVTLDNLLETNGRKINCTVGEYLKQTIERLETLGKYGSASKHRSLLSRLSQFRSLNIRFDEIDLAYLHDFELFLRKEGNTNNSIATKYAIFKAAYNKALAEGLFVPKTTPFTKYKVGSLWTRTRKRAITKEDIQKLVALEIWLPCATAILWMAGFTTPAIKRRNCCPFNSSRTPCGLSRNTARPTTHKKIISSLFSTARNTRQHNRFSTEHTRFCGKLIGN